MTYKKALEPSSPDESKNFLSNPGDFCHIKQKSNLLAEKDHINVFIFREKNPQLLAQSDSGFLAFIAPASFCRQHQ